MQKEKTAGANSGSTKPSQAAIFKGFDALNIAIDEEKLQQDLLAHLMRHKTVRLTCRCHGCHKPKSPLKMAAYATICRDCLRSIRSKGPTARNNFIERVKSNVGRFLREAVI